MRGAVRALRHVITLTDLEPVLERCKRTLLLAQGITDNHEDSVHVNNNILFIIEGVSATEV